MVSNQTRRGENMPDPFNDPGGWRGVEELVPQMLANDPNPAISDADLNGNQRAMAFYLARMFLKIAPMVVEDLEYMRLVAGVQARID